MLGTLVQRRLLYAVVFAVITAVGLLGLVLFNQQAAASASQVATVTLETVGSTTPGAAMTVQVVANDTRNLAGFQAKVRFDATKLRLLDASAANDLEKSGRDLLALEPVEQSGAVSIGAATCPVKDCHATQPKLAQRIDRGVNGRVVLATIEFAAEQPGQYALALENVKLVDPQGNAIAFTTSNAVLDVATQ
ncbi:MAG: hypothetical protein JOZ51_07345 [Chloroflexi bacterium]|nr:hypothetical protein [Chloroflexota bacterium]